MRQHDIVSGAARPSEAAFSVSWVSWVFWPGPTTPNQGANHQGWSKGSFLREKHNCAHKLLEALLPDVDFGVIVR